MTTFNLSDQIQEHNKKNKSPISPNETWGLIYLQNESLEFLNQNCDIAIIRDRFANSSLITKLAQNKKQQKSENTISPSTQQHAQVSTETDTQVNLSEKSKEKSFVNVAQQLAQELPVRERLKWENILRKNLNRIFRIFPAPLFQGSSRSSVSSNSSSSIEREILSPHQTFSLPFEQYSDAHMKFLVLQNMWHKHEAFMSFSDQSLCTYFYFVLFLMEHFRLALTEIKEQEESFFVFNRMPQAIAEEYKQFLMGCMNEFQAMRDAIIDTMFVRLKVAEATQLESSDASFYIAGTLDTLLLPSRKSDTLSSSSYLPDKSIEPNDFTKEDWHELQSAIAQSISPQHQKKLNELSWFDSQKGLLLTHTQIFEEERFIIPDVLKEEMPLWRGWPQWLFADRHTRINFIKAHQFDFARAKLMPLQAQASPDRAKEILASKNYEELFDQLKIFSSQQLSLKEQLSTEQQSHQKNPLSWWQFGTRRMQGLWQNELELRVQKNQRYFLAWCETLNEKLNELPKDSDFNVVSFMSCWQQIVEQSHFILQGVSRDEALRFTSVKNQMAKRLYSVPLQEAGNLFQALSEGKSISSHDMAFIKHCVVQMQILDKGRVEAERITPNFCKTYVNSAIDNLISQIETSLLSIRKNVPEKIDRVSSLEKSHPAFAPQTDFLQASDKILDSHIPVIRGIYVLPPLPKPVAPQKPLPKEPLPKEPLRKEPSAVKPFWPSPAESERLFIKFDLIKMLGSPIHETQLDNLLKDLLIRQSDFIVQSDLITTRPFITFLTTLIQRYANEELQKQWESLVFYMAHKTPNSPNPAIRWKSFQNHYAKFTENLVCESIDIQSEITISQLLHSCKEMLDKLAEKDEQVLFHDISTRLQNSGKTHLSELSLKPHEKVLTGVEDKEIETEKKPLSLNPQTKSSEENPDNAILLEHEKRKQVRETIELTARLHFFKSQIKASQTAAEKKFQVKALESVVSEKMPEQLNLFQP
jgi:hypothetical protein